MFVTYLQAVLKLFYLDWRPIFLSDQINSKYCDADYGKPSGHAISSSLLVPIALLIIYRPSSIVGKTTVYIASFVIVFCIIFSRLFFGKHSMNQLGLGIAIGVFFHVVFFFILDNWLNEKFYKPTVYGNRNNMDNNLDNNVQIQSDSSDIEKSKKNENILKKETSDKIEISENNDIPFIDMENKSFSNYKVILGLLFLSNMLMIIGVFAAKYFVEFPNSNFFNSFKNCMTFKDRYNSDFSSKIVRDGGAFNLFFGIILSHYHTELSNQNLESSNMVNIFQALKINFDNNILHMLIRLLFILFYLSPALISFIVGPMLNGKIGIISNIIMGLGLPLVCGYFLRFFYLKSLECCNISYFQIKNTETVKSNQEVN